MVPHGEDLEAHQHPHVTVAVQQFVSLLGAELLQLQARLGEEIDAQQQVAAPQLQQRGQQLLKECAEGRKSCQKLHSLS